MNIEGLNFHHIGIATGNIEESINIYERLGYISSKVFRDEIQDVELAFLKNSNDSNILELVSPYRKGSPVESILNKNGTIPYHICYEVCDLDFKIQQLRQLKFIQVSKKSPAVAFDGREICFLYHKDFGTLELLQK